METEDAKGFFASLFDFSFESFITSKIIRLLYILSVAGACLMYLVMVVGAFQASAGLGLATLLIIGPIAFLLMVIYARVVLEIIMVVFSIAENVRTISRKTGTPGVGPEGTPVQDEEVQQ